MSAWAERAKEKRQRQTTITTTYAKATTTSIGKDKDENSQTAAGSRAQGCQQRPRIHTQTHTAMPWQGRCLRGLTSMLQIVWKAVKTNINPKPRINIITNFISILSALLLLLLKLLLLRSQTNYLLNYKLLLHFNRVSFDVRRLRRQRRDNTFNLQIVNRDRNSR